MRPIWWKHWITTQPSPQSWAAQAAPNAAAALRYLEKTSPEIWGDNASGKPPENNLFEILRAGLSGDTDVSQKASEGED